MQEDKNAAIYETRGGRRRHTYRTQVAGVLAAAWAARKAKPTTAALHGLLVGFLVAVIFGVLYFGPSTLWGLSPLALMIAAGFVGGLIGRANAA